MPVFNDLQLKQWFETGDFPNQQQFFNLIDSKVNHLDLPSLLFLEVGVTPINSGYENSILFQQSGVVQQNPKFVFDPYNSRIGMDELAPLTRMHFLSSVGNTDAGPLTFTFQRTTGTYNSNTTWFSHRATNGSGQRVAAFAFAQQASGQGTRFSVLVTNDSATTQATEGLRLSQEKRLSVGNSMLNEATLDAIAETSLSTSKVIRARNSIDTEDIFQILGDKSLISSGSTSYDGIQTHSAGAAITIGGDVRTLHVDSSLLASLDITLPATSKVKNGQEINIIFGGTITSGTIVTSLNILANTGQTLIHNHSFGNTKAGDNFSFKWIAALNSWFSINNSV